MLLSVINNKDIIKVPMIFLIKSKRSTCEKYFENGPDLYKLKHKQTNKNKHINNNKKRKKTISRLFSDKLFWFEAVKRTRMLEDT